MKSIFLLLLFASTFSFAQLTKMEFDKQKKLILGNDPVVALKNLETLEKKFPKDAQVICLRGLYQFRDSDSNSALVSFSNAIKTNPKFTFAYACRAQVFAQKNLMEKAISDASQAILLEPKNIDLYTSRAEFYFKNNQFDLGLADTKTKIALGSKNIMDYFDAAVFTKNANANANGDVFFEQAYANKSIPKYVTDALFGKFLIKYGRFNEAKPKFETALATNEKDFEDDDFNNAGIVFYKTKNYDQAISCLNKAIAKNPKNSDFYVNLASVYMDKKDWQAVKQTAENGLKVNSNHPMTNMFMAIGLKYTGNENLALEYEAKAKRLDAAQNK